MNKANYSALKALSKMLRTHALCLHESAEHFELSQVLIEIETISALTEQIKDCIK